MNNFNVSMVNLEAESDPLIKKIALKIANKLK